MMLSKKRITKVLVRLRGCTGWSAPELFEKKTEGRFSRVDAHLTSFSGKFVFETLKSGLFAPESILYILLADRHFTAIY